MAEPEDYSIDQAIQALALPSSAAFRMGTVASADVVTQVKERFSIPGNPRALWMGLSPESKAPYVDWTERRALVEGALSQFPSLRCFLIVDSDGADWIVYDCLASVISNLLEESSILEFCAVDATFRLLLANSDHNEIMVATSSA